MKTSDRFFIATFISNLLKPDTGSAKFFTYFLSKFYVARAYNDQKCQQDHYPPDTPYIRQLPGKAECSGLTSPVKEKIGIVHTGSKLPALSIAYCGIYCVKHRRYDHEYRISAFDTAAGCDYKEISDRRCRNHGMSQCILNVPGPVSKYWNEQYDKYYSG